VGLKPDNIYIQTVLHIIFNNLNIMQPLTVKFTLEQAMNAQSGKKRYSSKLSLTSVLDRGGWLMPQPGCFTPREETWAPRLVQTDAKTSPPTGT
jgi:hypothetical protein